MNNKELLKQILEVSNILHGLITDGIVFTEDNMELRALLDLIDECVEQEVEFAEIDIAYLKGICSCLSVALVRVHNIEQALSKATLPTNNNRTDLH